jgi:hypothetical protein
VRDRQEQIKQAQPVRQKFSGKADFVPVQVAEASLQEQKRDSPCEEQGYFWERVYRILPF